MSKPPKKHRTDALIPRAGFWQGFFSVFSLFGTRFPQTPYGSLPAAEIDRRAMAADWGAVGQDIRSAMQQADTVRTPII